MTNGCAELELNLPKALLGEIVGLLGQMDSSELCERNLRGVTLTHPNGNNVVRICRLEFGKFL